MKTTFEQFLQNTCPGEVHTNNSPEGFENWLEQQDVNDIMEYAEMYGNLCRNEGQQNLLDEMREDERKLLEGFSYKPKVEMYNCPSIYDGEKGGVINCLCGKCKVKAQL